MVVGVMVNAETTSVFPVTVWVVVPLDAINVNGGVPLKVYVPLAAVTFGG
jgi:hypothetical protein